MTRTIDDLLTENAALSARVAELEGQIYNMSLLAMEAEIEADREKFIVAVFDMALVNLLPRWIDAMSDWDSGGEQAQEEMQSLLDALKGGAT